MLSYTCIHLWISSPLQRAQSCKTAVVKDFTQQKTFGVSLVQNLSSCALRVTSAAFQSAWRPATSARKGAFLSHPSPVAWRRLLRRHPMTQPNTTAHVVTRTATPISTLSRTERDLWKNKLQTFQNKLQFLRFIFYIVFSYFFRIADYNDST